LAQLYGVQTSYTDIIARRQRQAPAGALRAVLRALGASLEHSSDAPAAIRERRQQLWQRLSEPVVVAWEGRGELELRLPAALSEGSLACRLKLETGERREWACEWTTLSARQTTEVEGVRYATGKLPLAELPHGYHRLEIALGGHSAQTLLISAPSSAFVGEKGADEKNWGTFLPLHSLCSRTSWGAGDFSDLGRLMDWVAEQGGGVVATLPFLAAFLDEPFEPSPYMPASRLFWNEFFLHVEGSPELAHSPAAQDLLANAEFQREVEGLRAAPLVDYRRGMALKRRVLAELAKALMNHGSERLQAFREFIQSHPLLQDYARFRATGERLACPWPAWPGRQRQGDLQEGDFDESARHYHLYVQWLAHQQLGAFAEKARRRGPGLYLDLPLGVHPDSYDVWRQREAFASGVSGGSPPDSFFTKGQDWGFRPLHPERIREQGYRYFIACVRHHLSYAGILRIDHVMGLHRLFWVPQGMKASDGVYVRYRPEEFYAILALESVRSRALVVGEDLGTVPPAVRPAMAHHRVHRTYVTQYELNPEPGNALSPPSVRSLAGMNTHDMPTFAAYWDGLDIQDRVELSLLDQAGAEREREGRAGLKKSLAAFLRGNGWLEKTESGPEAALKATLAFLAASRARVVVVSLEDLWGEKLPQNVPGTGAERPNWKRKAQYPLEEFCQLAVVLDTLKRINSKRKEGEKAE